MICSSCGKSIGADARFCPRCGASQVVASEERRIVTVLFADIVGFTSLSEHRDPEEVKHLVDKAFERLVRDITSYGGVIDKVLGDGIVALFGAPIAHEDDAERAVRAGLRMQQTMQALSLELDPPIDVRIGVNTGEVLVGGTAAGGDYTAMGDVVNSADRLQKLAQPGQTLVGMATRVATGDAITYEPAGSLPARGRGEPLDAWVALQAVRPPGLQRERRGVFVGREPEMDLLAAQSRLAIEGHRAQLALIVGDAGIGKTRLVHEIAGFIAGQSRARVLEGRCLPYGEANVWWPVAEVVRHLFDLSIDAPQAEVDALLRKTLPDHLDVDPEAVEVERFTTSLLHTLGYDTVLRGGDRSRNRSEVMLVIAEVLEAELRRRPVVLLMSDMHWAAEAVWLLFNNLLSDLVRHRLIVLMTTRPAELTLPPNGRNGLTVLQLGPLDTQASATLLADLGAELAPVQVEDLVARSGGNPFFLEELAGLVATHGLNDDQASEFDVDTDGLPATLRGLISARLDALDVAERALLEDASVLGRTGPITGLATLSAEAREVDDITAALDGLVANDLLVIDGPRFRFRSNLVRDVTYGRLTKTVRAQRHLGIATYLDDQQGETVRNSVVVQIAEHYRAAAQLSNELSALAGLDLARITQRASYWLEQAGDRALDVGAPFEAARWYDYGIALAADDEDALAQFVFGRARARTEVHDIAGARADLERLEGLEGLNATLAARAVLVRGDVDRKAGDLSSAVTTLTTAAGRLAELGDTSNQALALRLLGMAEMARSNNIGVSAALEASRAVAVAAGDRRAEGWALQSLAWQAFRMGRLDEARTMVDAAVTSFTEVDDQGALAWAQGVEAWVAFNSGDWDRARDLLDRVLSETRRRGDPQAEAIMTILDATLRLWSGRAQTAEEMALKARSVAERADDVTLAVMARTVQGRSLVSQGRIDDGTALLEEAYRLADKSDDDESRRVAVVSICASAARLGEPERTIRWAARYDNRDGADPGVLGETDLVVSLALALLQRGSVEEAAAQLDVGGDGEVPHFAQAVGSLLAAARHDDEAVHHLSGQALVETATYLDRVLAWLAVAAMRSRALDTFGCDQALAAARLELEPTDDQVTRQLVDLASAVYGRSSIPDAESRMRRAGLDPTGWLQALSIAVRPRIEGTQPRG